MELPDIQADIMAAASARRKIYPCHNNRASSIGDPCWAYLYFERTAWQEKALPDPTLQLIFELGNMYESEWTLKRLLQPAGYEVRHEQRSFSITTRTGQITGHQDFSISKDGQLWIPIEAKSMAPHIWNATNSIADMTSGKHWWSARYPAQIQLYLFGGNAEQGAFILINKSTGQPKVMPVTLDLEYCEGLLQKSESIDRAVSEKAWPNEWRCKDYDRCNRCDYQLVCLPDLKGLDCWTLIDDEELAQMCLKWRQLGESAKEYKDLNDKLKAACKGKDGVLLDNGHILINGKEDKNGKWLKDIKFLDKPESEEETE